MNRKREAKLIKKAEKAKALHFDHPYDDPLEWVKGGFETPPWPKEKIEEFQKRLDSAFEAPNGMVLAWSGDRSYGDVFYNEKGELERKPVLLFAEHKVNANDYVYITCPRWLVLQVHHGSQLEDGWEEASFVTNEFGKNVRIRPERPPEFFYEHFQIIAEHEQTINIGAMPPCCVRMMAQNRICYGKYREPDYRDIALVGETRKRMNKAGVFQRNDEKRSAKLLQDAASSTRYFIKRAQEQKALHIQNVMLENYEVFFDDILEKNPMSPNEIRSALKEAFDQQNQERFA